MEEKNLDMIVANDVSAKGAGFYVDTNIATLLPRKGRAEYLPKMTKLELATKSDAISRLKKINGNNSLPNRGAPIPLKLKVFP